MRVCRSVAWLRLPAAPEKGCTPLLSSWKMITASANRSWSTPSSAGAFCQLSGAM
ncbi:MAG: hypothetical protein WDN24_14395 [Sphingomonas sp.]